MSKSPQNTIVSVIILNYNGREHLDACLSSLLDLDFPKEQLEVIVVDNGSTDGSVGFIKSAFPDIHIIENEINLGFSRAANVGASKATGEYVAFLNNDMRVDKKWLKILVDIAGSKQGAACVGSTVLKWDGKGVDFEGRTDDAFCLSYTPEDTPLTASLSNSQHHSFFVSGGAALFERSVFQEVGGFDPDFFFYHEDVDLCWRLWLRGHECVLSSESIVYHRGGASSNKLAPEFVNGLTQKHTLFSVFKNLENSNLKEILPALLYTFLERNRWVPAARESLPNAIHEFQGSLESLRAKRKDVQSTRQRSDARIFAMLGHPFNFLLRQESYESIRKELLRGPEIEFDACDAESVRFAIAEWLNRAHFLCEANLNQDLVESRNECQVAADEIESFKAAFEESERIRRELDVTLRARDEAILILQGKAEELDKINHSPGGRLLNHYGRFKYRYLLPTYRLLGLPPYDRSTHNNKQVVSLPAQHDLALESNACDVVCFPIIDWDFRFQRPQQLMSRLADAGHRVFYISQQFHYSGPAYTIKEKRRNIYEISLRGPKRNIYEGVLDEKARESLFDSLNELRRDLLLGATIAFVQLPFWWPLVAKARDEFAWPIVYDCMDHHAGFSTNKQIMLDQETDLLASADLVVVSSSL